MQWVQHLHFGTPMPSGGVHPIAFLESEAYARLILERTASDVGASRRSGDACDLFLKDLHFRIAELEKLDRYRTPRLRAFLRACLIAAEQPEALIETNDPVAVTFTLSTDPPPFS